jgi:hypothetical protein
MKGYLTKIPPSRQIRIPILDRIPCALRTWRNLQKVTLRPQQASPTALHKIVVALRTCPYLKSITVNDLAMGEDIVPDLVELSGLEEVNLVNPTRSLFMALADWIGRMQNTIIGLHLLVCLRSPGPEFSLIASRVTAVL